MRGLWLAVLAAVTVAWASDPARAACVLGRFGELPVTMVGLAPTVPLKVNGVDVRMVADSGAFFSLLTPQAASRIKLKVTATPYGPAMIQGLGGVEEAGIATASDFSIFGMTIHHADFLVAAPQLGEEGVDGLLGGNILSYADVEFDLANGAIRLFKPNGCPSNVSLAYWATDGKFSDVPMVPAKAPEFKIVVHVQVNGRDMRAILDSGAGRSYISRVAARQAGVSTDAEGVKSGDMGGGIGGRRFHTWIAPFQSFKIGDEEVKFTQLRVADGELTDADMLLGADFLLSHRVYVANSEHRLYFSYNGGPVFNLDRDDGAAPAAAPSPGSAPTTATSTPAIPGAPTDHPTDADGFSRRASAFMARRDFAGAIADYTRAAELEPTVARHLLDRAQAHFTAKQDAQGRSDLDQALKLEPDNVDALMLRARWRFEADDAAGGRADLEAVMRKKPEQRINAAIILTDADLFDAAITDLDGWLADNPKDISRGAALNDRCWARALSGHDLDKALDDCNAALKLIPNAGGILDSRGLVNLRLGHPELAIADYDNVLKRYPKTSWSLYGRGLAEARLGQTKASEADFAAAAALAPKLAEHAKRLGIAP
jgi:tetratricopeptide (TPR) repeat protein